MKGDGTQERAATGKLRQPCSPKTRREEQDQDASVVEDAEPPTSLLVFNARAMARPREVDVPAPTLVMIVKPGMSGQTRTSLRAETGRGRGEPDGHRFELIAVPPGGAEPARARLIEDGA